MKQMTVDLRIAYRKIAVRSNGCMIDRGLISVYASFSFITIITFIT